MSAATIQSSPSPGLALPRRRMIGLVLFGSMAAFALLGPWLIAVDPLKQDLRSTLNAPGDGFLLGADHLGRSMAARLAHAARLSLTLGGITVVSAAVPGSCSASPRPGPAAFSTGCSPPSATPSWRFQACCSS